MPRIYVEIEPGEWKFFKVAPFEERAALLAHYPDHEHSTDREGRLWLTLPHTAWPDDDDVPF